MRKQPRLNKPTDIFRRKIIVTFPPWAVFVFGAVIGVSIGVQITRMFVIFLLIITLCALTATWAQHRMVNELRYSIHNLLHGIENDNRYPHDEPATFAGYMQPEIERIPLKDVSAKNGHSSSRVSKR